MKKFMNDYFPRGKVLKCIIMMKMVWIFVLASALQVTAGNMKSYSQATKLNLRLKNVSLESVIWNIKKQTEFSFFYNSEDIKGVKNIDVDLEDVTVEEILLSVLDGTNLTFDIVHKAIIIRKDLSPSTDPEGSTEVDKPDKKNLTGKVTDQKGEPLPGVTIVVKGTTIGTVTDINGNFSLLVPLGAEILQFSFVGMKTKEIPIGGKDIFNIILEEETTGLDEVVVVGYGIQKRESVTGAISSVEPEKLKQSSSVSLGSTLAGRISGLTALTGSGQPGLDDPVLFLRGISTFNDASPLIIIDGVPRDNIRQINPNEIASISVLKDASATAVFGVRGANGAIIITTRRGKKGPGKLVVNAEQGYSSFTFEPERLHSVEYLRLRNEAAQNDGLDAPYSEEIISKYENPLAGLDPNNPDYEAEAKKRMYMYPDHDYFRKFISRYTPQTRVNANLSGGGEKLSYFVNAGFINQGGNLKTEPESDLGYDPSVHMMRYSFRTNVDYKISPTVSSFLNLSTNIERVNMPSPWRYNNSTQTMMRAILQDAKTILPITPGPTTIAGFDIPAGETVEVGYMSNKSTFRMMNREGYRNEVSSILNSSWGLNWDLSKIVTPGLSVDGQISFDSRAATIVQGNTSDYYYAANVNYVTDELSYTLTSDEEVLLSLQKSARSRYTINLQGKINYNRQFKKHKVGGMILAQRDYWESYAGEIPYNVLGIAARATYDFDNRYFGEINMGYNGSEQFAPDNRFGFFPAMSLGWVASNENFLKENKILTYLKFRGSYGKAGNDKIASQRFLYLDNIEMSGGTLPSLGRGQGIAQGLLGNPELSWEISWKQNYGVELRIVEDFHLSFDYFSEERSNILITRGLIPAFQGVPLGNIPKANMGEVKNNGYEIELSYNKTFNKDFSLMLTGNYGVYKNEVTYADEPIRDEEYAYRYRSTGFPLGQNWGYEIDWESNGGYWTSEEEILNSGLSYDFGIPRIGDFKYVDQNDDDVINDKDQVPIGYSGRSPESIYGLTMTINYKAFDFMVFFQGVGNYFGYYQLVGVFETQGLGSYMGYHKNAWTPERYENNEKILYPALSTGNTTNHVPNDFFIMDRSYTRLKNIEVGYTLRKGKLTKAGINGLRIYASGQNLYTWEHLRMDHLDPESDSHQYPITKMINFGLEVTF